MNEPLNPFAEALAGAGLTGSLLPSQEERSVAWRTQQAAIRREFSGWFRINVDCRATPQTPLKGDDFQGVAIQTTRKGFELVLPFPALTSLEAKSYVFKLPPADGRKTAPNVAKAEFKDLQRTAARLFKVAEELERDGRQWGFSEESIRTMVKALRAMASSARAINGGYYVKHAPRSKDMSETKTPDAGYKENWQARLVTAEAKNLADLAWACEEVLAHTEGVAAAALPLYEQITDFYLEPLFVLHKASRRRVRMLNVRTRHGEVFGFRSWEEFGPQNRPLELTGEASKSPTNLRDWVQTFASGNWGAGEKEWQLLTADLNRQFAWQTVEEVTQFGHHAPSRSWWYADCVVPDDSDPVKAVPQGYFKIELDGKKEKYLIGEKDREGREWVLAHESGNDTLPRMHPDVAVTDAEVRALALRLALTLEKWIGGIDAWMALGSVWAYFAAPEVYSVYKCFPGLFIHGEKGKGKTTLGRILSAVHGFGPKGIDVDLGSVPALENGLAQFSNLPVVLEEFQTDVKDGVNKVLKASFDRSKIPKMLSSKDGTQTSGRTPGTAPIVVGQATSADAAGKSRFLHIQVREDRRKSDETEFRWLSSRANLEGEYWKLGRFLLRHRTRFAARVLEELAAWNEADDAKVVRDHRTRLIHGLPYAAFKVLFELLGQPMAAPVLKLREWLVNEAQRAAAEVQEQVEISKFWQILANALTLGGFSVHGEPEVKSLRRIFRVYAVGPEQAHPPGLPEGTVQDGPWRVHVSELAGVPTTYGPARGKGGKWCSFRVDIARGPAIAMLQRWVSSRGERMPLKTNDLTKQMSEKPWFVEPKKLPGGDTTKVHFPGQGSERPWTVDLDRFEGMGYCPVPDATWKEWHADGRLRGEPDPRLGPLYLLVDKLLAPAREGEE